MFVCNVMFLIKSQIHHKIIQLKKYIICGCCLYNVVINFQSVNKIENTPLKSKFDSTVIRKMEEIFLLPNNEG